MPLLLKKIFAWGSFARIKEKPDRLLVVAAKMKRNEVVALLQSHLSDSKVAETKLSQGPIIFSGKNDSDTARQPLIPKGEEKQITVFG